MNRYVLTAKSLAIPESWILRIGMIIGILIAIIFLACGTEFGFSGIAALCMTGVAHNTYLFSRSERRRTVPGMNETAAEVAIWIAIGLSLVAATLTIILHGFALDFIALSFLMIAIGMWLGWGERLVFWLLSIFVGLTFLFLLALENSFALQNFVYRLLPQLLEGEWTILRNVFGAVLGGCGFWTLKRFWKLAASEEHTEPKPRLHDLIEQQIATFSTASPAIEGEAASTAPSVNASRYALARLGHLLYGKSVLTRKGYLLVSCAAILVLAVMIFSRGNQVAMLPTQFIASIIIVMVPFVAFSVRVPQSFSRAWIMGIAENRTTTARQLLLLVVKRSLPAFAVITTALAIQSGTSLTNLIAMLFGVLAAIGCSGILLWSLARRYPFWSRQSDVTIMIAMILATLVLGGLGIFVAAFDRTLLREYQNHSGNILAYIATPQSLAICTLAVLGIWVWCTYDASKGLGRAIRLME